MDHLSDALTLELTWLGQAGFAVTRGETRLLIDPFLSADPSRLWAHPDPAGVADGVDWLLVTHEHGDHLDLGFIKMLLERSPSVRIVVPAALVPALNGLCRGEQLHAVIYGDQLDLAPGISVEVVPACHAVEVAAGYGDGSSGAGPARFAGYLLSLDDVGIYHSGDTLVTAELVRALSGRSIDVALLPINGRDYFREEAGIVGNMSAREAVILAERLGAGTLVPMHWDLTKGNTEHPGAVLNEVADGARDIHVLVLAPMRPYRLRGAGHPGACVNAGTAREL